MTAAKAISKVPRQRLFQRVDVFPDVLVRLGGGSFHQFAKLNFHKTMKRLEEIGNIKKRRYEQRNLIQEALYHLIANCSDETQKKKLLNLKRKLKNGNSLVIHDYRSFVSNAIFDQLCIYGQLDETLQIQRELGAQSYQEEIDALRSHLSILVGQENLQSGLLLSSQVLLKQIEKYQTACPNKIKKKELKTELSLIKYLGRIYTKTSPFSTFTRLDYAELSPSIKECSQKIFKKNSNSSLQTRSHVRINIFLFKYITGLLIQNKSINRHLIIRKNPTLKRKGTDLVFLTNVNNTESFQTLEQSPLIDFILTFLSSSKHFSRTFLDLQKTLRNAVEASEFQIANYIKELIAIGLLEYSFETSGTDPDWDLSLSNELRPLEKHAAEISVLINQLTALRLLSRQYENATIVQKSIILEQACDLVNKIGQDMLGPQTIIDHEGYSNAEDESSSEEKFIRNDQRSLTFEKEQILFEDTTTQANIRLDNNQIHQFCDKLQELSDIFYRLDFRQYEQRKMKLFFDQRYPETQQVDLLTFYEDYYRDYKKAEIASHEKFHDASGKTKDAHSDPKPGFKPNPLLDPIRLKNDAWLTKLVARLKEKIDTSPDDIHLSKADFGPIHGPICPPNLSQAIFTQFVHSTSKSDPLKGVINMVTPGHGKFFSRFLHLFDGEITERVSELNHPKDEHLLFIENCDASVFNANLHPPLMKNQIWMPGSQNSVSRENLIPVTQIFVMKKEHSLALIHKPTGKEVHVFDLGFQGQKGRSQLFQLLLSFNAYSSTLNLKPLVSKINGRSQRVLPLEFGQFMPRITYEDQVVIQRKTWQIQTDYLPQKGAKETEWDYFERVHSWRMELNLPLEVFVSLDPYRKLAKDPKNRIGWDDYKPQYLHFGNPFLIRLFGKLVNKAHKFLHVEEMLPNSADLLDLNDKPYVSEYIVQWSAREGREND